ncbi:hypothetical protein AGLY_006157 [Aphis glycines]|uniref:Uncharacterized protein n=1 Tax=Aphis glycines TaxID=307491 RepID=A0A6G0TT12_APHGL|nr:hypothetical protein AGLY_006157 [Aphis glycines]
MNMLDVGKKLHLVCAFGSHNGFGKVLGPKPVLFSMILVPGIKYTHEPQFTPQGFLHKCLNKQFELGFLHIWLQFNCSKHFFSSVCPQLNIRQHILYCWSSKIQYYNYYYYAPMIIKQFHFLRLDSHLLKKLLCLPNVHKALFEDAAVYDHLIFKQISIFSSGSCCHTNHILILNWFQISNRFKLVHISSTLTSKDPDLNNFKCLIMSSSTKHCHLLHYDSYLLVDIELGYNTTFVLASFLLSFDNRVASSSSFFIKSIGFIPFTDEISCNNHASKSYEFLNHVLKPFLFSTCISKDKSTIPSLRSISLILIRCSFSFCIEAFTSRLASTYMLAHSSLRATLIYHAQISIYFLLFSIYPQEIDPRHDFARWSLNHCKFFSQSPFKCLILINIHVKYFSRRPLVILKNIKRDPINSINRIVY